MPVYFYSPKEQPYGCFSNFSRHGFDIDGIKWRSSIHYFQAHKFVGTEYFSRVAHASSPSEAAQLGQSKEHPKRSDWEHVKEEIMREALEAKFIQHHNLKELLLSTGDEEIIENSPHDSYWGCGEDGNGKNRLGVLLMELRTKFRCHN